MRKKLRLKNKFIPVNIPKLSNQEKINVKKCLTSGWISSEGKYVYHLTSVSLNIKFSASWPFSKFGKRLSHPCHVHSCIYCT